ncbi:hypothetical protein CCR75_008009 [Bremia lactucae]|uniref:Uncharacterized protein n=1 Tax=Bremia lactucae TaxID=4779 RepID=A0A976FH00_BRELC|nr:hypothetical protein CCR75_008009 [Bremia lactucae]
MTSSKKLMRNYDVFGSMTLSCATISAATPPVVLCMSRRILDNKKGCAYERLANSEDIANFVFCRLFYQGRWACCIRQGRVLRRDKRRQVEDRCTRRKRIFQTSHDSSFSR